MIHKGRFKMRSLTNISLTFLLILSTFFVIQTVASSRIYHVTSSSQHFPLYRGTGPYINFADSMIPVTFTTFYASSGRHYFNSSWIATTVDMTITRWSSLWFNYTASGGTQTIYEPKPKPNAVYFNGVSRTEGNGWSFSDQKVIVTPSGTSVAVFWGTLPSGSGGYSSGGETQDNPEQGGLTTDRPNTALSAMLIIILIVACLILLWKGIPN